MDFTMNETKQAVGGYRYRSIDRWVDIFWVIEITWDFGHAPMDARCTPDEARRRRVYTHVFDGL